MNDAILIHALKIDYEIKERDGETLCKFKYRIITKFSKYGDNKHQYLQDDLNSVAIQGIIEGIKSYNPQQGTKLTTWCFYKIMEKVREFIATEKKLKGVVEKAKQGQEYLTISIEQSAEKINQDTVQFLTEALKKIPSRQALFIRSHLGMDKSNNGNGQTFVELAENAGVSKQRAQQIYNQGIKNLRKEFLKIYPELFQN
jgi:RNA polymerase sigma factor (sigma-70 family)